MKPPLIWALGSDSLEAEIQGRETRKGEREGPRGGEWKMGHTLPGQQEVICQEIDSFLRAGYRPSAQV